MGSIVFRGLIEAIANNSEKWSKDHKEVMAKYKIADNLKEAAHQLCQLLLGFEKSIDDCENFHEFNLSWGEAVGDLYREWYSAATSILKTVSLLESEGFKVDGSDRLREIAQRVCKTLPEVDRVLGRIADIRMGKCVLFKATGDVETLASRECVGGAR